MPKLSLGQWKIEFASLTTRSFWYKSVCQKNIKIFLTVRESLPFWLTDTLLKSTIRSACFSVGREIHITKASRVMTMFTNKLTTEKSLELRLASVEGTWHLPIHLARSCGVYDSYIICKFCKRKRPAVFRYYIFVRYIVKETRLGRMKSQTTIW